MENENKNRSTKFADARLNADQVDKLFTELEISEDADRIQEIWVRLSEYDTELARITGTPSASWASLADDWRAYGKRNLVVEAPFHDRAIGDRMEAAVTEMLLVTKALGGDPVGLIVTSLKNIGDWGRLRDAVDDY